MLRGQNIICISSIDWDFLWQQHQEIMATFAHHGNTVLFIENTGVRAPRFSDASRLLHRLRNWRNSLWGFRKERDHLYVYSPIILPFPYSRIAHWINRWIIVTSLRLWMRSARFHDPVIWTFLPTRITLDIAEAIEHRLFVYYATDNFSATSKGAMKVTRVEPEVVKAADLVFVNSKNRLEYCRQFSRNVVQVPMGVCAEFFEEAKQRGLAPPDELAAAPTPIIGYVGGVRPSIDQELVARLAEQFPRCSLVFVGPIQTNIERLKKFQNIMFLGRKPHETLPSYIDAFTCGIVPYRKDEYTDSVSAAKLHEYLIMGKSVVSTNIAEVEAYARTIPSGSIYVAGTHGEFVSRLQQALAENGRHAEQSASLARERSWQHIIETMSTYIQQKLVEAEAVPPAWQEQFLLRYRGMRRRVFSVLGTIAIAGLLLFKTPFVWWLVAPLKAAAVVRPADAIVVFAGGVGESGQAGQGYEERVQRAVELYQQGMAPNLIFSSGYMYRFQEPFVMKALAVQLGIPPDAILLEEHARNTYENVVNTKNILDQHGWHSVLLVSSPYHMRRALWVWHKAAPGYEVMPAPIEQSEFYNRIHGVQLRHIRALLHEYVAIIFYAWKGYL